MRGNSNISPSTFLGFPSYLIPCTEKVLPTCEHSLDQTIERSVGHGSQSARKKHIKLLSITLNLENRTISNDIYHH